MKIKMIETPKGRPEYKAGETYEFNGPLEEGYARKFVARGWAEPVDGSAKEAAREDNQTRATATAAEAQFRNENREKIKAATNTPRHGAHKT